MSGAYIGAGFGSSAPFASTFRNTILALGPSRFYALGSAAANGIEPDMGSDRSSGTSNGTWSASGASQVKGMVIGEQSNAALLDGVAGRLVMPTANLPTGAASWSMGAVMQFQKIQAGLQYAFLIGDVTTLQHFVAIAWGNTAHEVTWGGAVLTDNYASGLSSVLTEPTLVVITYNGTTVAFWHNDFLVATSAAALALAYPGANANIGADGSAGGASFGQCSIQDWFLIKGTVLTQAQMSTLYHAFRGT